MDLIRHPIVAVFCNMAVNRLPSAIDRSWRHIFLGVNVSTLLISVIQVLPASAADFLTYPQTPNKSVRATPEEDAWAINQASHIFISRIAPGNEFAEGSDAAGAVLPGVSEGNSMSRCPSKGILCLHTHPLQDVGSSVRLVVKVDQPWRLGFGVLDYQAVVNGMPNYMLDYQRQLHVLEYIPLKGYYTRSLGIIEYIDEK